jgi:hypothetical protein
MGDIIGRAFVNDHLKPDQLTSVKWRYEKAGNDDITLWNAYLILAASIQHSHPKSYTRSHIGCFDVVYEKYLTRYALSLTPNQISEQVALSITPEVADNQMSIFDVIDEQDSEIQVDMTNDLLIPGFDYDVDKQEVFDFEEEVVPFDTTPVPDAFYEDQVTEEKVENNLPESDELFNFDGVDQLDLPEL